MIAGNETPALAGVSVIVVEDNFVVAQSLKWLLESFGCTFAGMAGTVDAALGLIDSVDFDVAILDIALDKEDVAPVATRIREVGRRLIYVTGYGDNEMLPEHLRDYPRLSKPVDPDRLVETILETVSEAAPPAPS